MVHQTSKAKQPQIPLLPFGVVVEKSDAADRRAAASQPSLQCWSLIINASAVGTLTHANETKPSGGDSARNVKREGNASPGSPDAAEPCGNVCEGTAHTSSVQELLAARLRFSVCCTRGRALS